MTADWSDPRYVAAKRARAAAYAELNRAADQNPHKPGRPGWSEYYQQHVAPLVPQFMEASERLRQEIERLMNAEGWRD